MELQEDFEELQDIIDALENCIKYDCKKELNKEYIRDCLSPFYHEYKEIYEKLEEESKRELEELNYDWGGMRI